MATTKPKYVGDASYTRVTYGNNLQPYNQSYDNNLARVQATEQSIARKAAIDAPTYSSAAEKELQGYPTDGNWSIPNTTSVYANPQDRLADSGRKINASGVLSGVSNIANVLGTSGASSLAKLGSSTSGGSTGSGSGSGSGTGAYAAYMQLAAAQMASQQARAEEAARAQREAAMNAYNRGMNSLTAAYNNKLNVLGDNYNSTMGQLNNALGYSTGNVNRDADAALKQAYINRMMNERNLGQQLTAQGLSGGATETTLARLLNNYGNSRNNIEGNRADNLNELYNTYNNNVASANQAYNSALAQAEAERMQYAMNLENALANNQIATEQNYQNALTSNNDVYLDALARAVDKMNQYNYTKSAATNDVNLATVLQNAVNSGVYNRNPETGAIERTATAEEQANNNAYINALLKQMYGV